MADRLKGITLEIGGDTTKLSKALSGVNSDIINTKSALKDVERLLKLDPGNVELLRQKQKLLATSVKETSDKLKTLKSASEQAAKTADKYDAWKAAYDPIQKEITETSSALSELKKQQEKMKDAGEVNTDAYKQLSEEVKSTEKTLRDLKKQAKAVTDEFGNPISPEQFDSLQREIVETETNLKNLKKESRDFGSVFTQQLDAVGDKLTAAGDKITAVGKKVSVLSGTVTAAGIGSAKLSMDFEDAMAKVSTIADTSQIPIEELESAILNLSDESGVAASDIANNVYDAISAGQSTADAVNFVSNATTLARAGFTDTSSALDILTTIMNAYGLEASEVNNVCDTLITTQNLGKTTVAELAASMGKVIPTAKAQGVTLNDLCSAYAILTANGISTAEATTYLNAMLNELGKTGSQAEKALSDSIERAYGKEMSMAELMKEDGVALITIASLLYDQSVKTGTSIANMFGSAEGGKAAAVLHDNLEQLLHLYGAMYRSAGSTEAAYGKLETKSFQTQKSINELKNVDIQLGDTLMQTLGPIIDDITEKIRQFSEWFSGLSDGQKETIVKIGMVVAAAGPLLIIIGQICSGIGSICHAFGSLGPAISFVGDKLPALKTAFSGAFSSISGKLLPGLSSAFSGAFSFISGTIVPGLSSALSSAAAFISANPIVLIIAGIVAVVAALVTLYNKCEWFRDGVNAIFGAIKDFFVSVWEGICGFFTETIPAAWDSVVGFFQGIPDWWHGIWQTVSDTAAEKWEEVRGNVVTGADAMQGGIQKLDDYLQGVFATDWTETFGPVLGGALNNFFDNVSGIWDGIKSTMDGVIEVIKGVFTGDWEQAWNGVKDIFGGIFETMEAYATVPLNGIITLLNSIIDGANWCIDKLNQIPGVNLDTIGNLPFFANGGTLTRGSAVVGDAGPEILTVSGGKATVTPLTGSASGGSAQSFGAQPMQTTVHVQFAGSLSQLAAVLQPAISAETRRLGGNFAR